SWYLFSLKVEEPASRQRMVLAQIPSELRDGLLSLRNDPHSLLAVSQLIVSSSLVLLFAILIPRYMNDILRISPDNAAFVFAPTGVGALIGLRFLPWFIRRYGKSQAVVVGLCGIAISLIGFVLVKPLAEAMELTPGPLNPERFLGLSLLQALTMAFAGPLGFSYSFLNAPAQTVLHERAREDMRGRVFATQVAFANFISLLPVLFIGALTDLLDSFSNLQGITAVLLLIALGVLIMATVSWLLDRRMKQAEVATARAAPPV
ncbi:MAG TPA: MFS transporter, partial [Dehalococcoidia bacterium]|nr:MFS transporter [Dehalococcoidia bacterium]